MITVEGNGSLRGSHELSKGMVHRGKIATELHGSGKPVYNDEHAKSFYQTAILAHPTLDPDFILDCCLYHPNRMNDYFPDFDIQSHAATRRIVSAEWIQDNLSYDMNEPLDTKSFYGDDVEKLLSSGTSNRWLVNQMIRLSTWPNAPIIVSRDFALSELGAHPHIIRGHTSKAPKTRQRK